MGVKPDPKSELGIWFFEEKRDLEPGVNSLVQLWISKNWTKTNHDFQNLNQTFFVSKYQNLCMEPEVEPIWISKNWTKTNHDFQNLNQIIFIFFGSIEIMHGTGTGTKIVLILSKKLEVVQKRKRTTQQFVQPTIWT